MDWSSITRLRGEGAVLLGFVLLLNPFAVAALDVGDPDWYRYEATQVEFFDNGTYDYDIGAGRIDPDVACFDDLPSRACTIERAVHANGGVTYDGLTGNYMTSSYDYVFVWKQGFFEPVATETANETIRYDLEKVRREQALRHVSTSLEAVSPGVRTAIVDGQYRTSDELAGANELVSTADGSYVVYPAAYHTEEGERSDLVVVLQWLLGIVGAWLVLSGQRLRVDRDRN
ncbi:MAG: hypothetical protein ABEJ92_02980 [Halobacteriales archaeon]